MALTGRVRPGDAPPRPLPPTHARSERGTRVPCPGTHVADVVDLDREGRNRPCAAGMSDATQSSFTRAARVVAFLGAARAPCGPCAAELGPLRRRTDLSSPPRRSSDLSSHRSARYWAVKMDKASNGPLRGRDNARAAQRPVTRPLQTSRGRLHQWTRALCPRRRLSHEAAPPSPPRMPPQPQSQ